MAIIDEIRLHQTRRKKSPDVQLPQHRPRLFYIGCIDARLDPIEDIGIELGAALIYRNAGALVLDDDRALKAALELYLNHMPSTPGERKQIAISGHTDCGCMRACHAGDFSAQDHHLPLHLEGLREMRGRVMAEAQARGWNEVQSLRALEQEAVRQSTKILLGPSYPMVGQALKEGRAQHYSWLINTATKQITEMNPQTLEFRPMAAS